MHHIEAFKTSIVLLFQRSLVSLAFLGGFIMWPQQHSEWNTAANWNHQMFCLTALLWFCSEFILAPDFQK